MIGAITDAGRRQVKNIADPVHVFRVANLGEPRVAPTTIVDDKPSIAVLPFTNMSNDPEQEFLADGIAEDVITTLSRYPSLLVIARNSTFTYKGRAVNIKQVGHELGVPLRARRWFTKSRQSHPQLVEAETGNHVWAEPIALDPGDAEARSLLSQALSYSAAMRRVRLLRRNALWKDPP